MITQDWTVMLPPIVFAKLATGEINRRQFVLWCVIAWHDRHWTPSEKGGYCTLGNEKLGQEAGGISPTQVSRDISQLAKAGLIEIVESYYDKERKKYVRTLSLSARCIEQMRKGVLSHSARELNKEELNKRNVKYKAPSNFQFYDWVNKKQIHEEKEEQYNPIQWMLERWS